MADPDPWLSLFRTFALDRGYAPPIPPPPADLDRFEAETGIRLPAGFRGYLGVFGPGCLLVGRGNNIREMFISSPYCPDRPLNLMTAVERLRLLREDPPRGLDDRMKRLVVFGRDGLGHEYGWDPEEVTDPAAPEFAVYAWYRGDHGYRVSRTFAGFIQFVLDVAARREHSLNPCDREDSGATAFAAPAFAPGPVFRPVIVD